MVEERGLQMRRALEKKEAQQTLEGLISVSLKDHHAGDDAKPEEVVAELTFDDLPCAETVDEGAARKITPQCLESIFFGHLQSPRSSERWDRTSTDFNALGASFDGGRRDSCETGMIVRELIDKESVLQLLVDENRSLRLFVETLKQTILGLGGDVPEFAPQSTAHGDEATVQASPAIQDTKGLDALQAGKCREAEYSASTRNEIMPSPSRSPTQAGSKHNGLHEKAELVECCRCRQQQERQLVRSRSWPASTSLHSAVPLRKTGLASFHAEMESVAQSFAQRQSSIPAVERECEVASSSGIFNQNAVSFFDSIVSGLTLGVGTPSKRAGEAGQISSQGALVNGLKKQITSLEYNNDQLLLFVLDARERYPELYLPDLC